MRPQDEGQVPEDVEREWAQALLRIRTRDPAIYRPSTRLFARRDAGSTDAAAGADVEDAPAGSGDQPPRKTKRQTLRQIQFEQVSNCSTCRVALTRCPDRCAQRSHTPPQRRP